MTTTSISPLDMPAINGRGVTEAHTRICAERGHATHTRDGVDTGVCPRCGEVTTPAPAPCYACDWNLRSHQHTCR